MGRAGPLEASLAVRVIAAMCKLYSMTRTQDAMRALFRVKKDLTGNLPPMPDDFDCWLLAGFDRPRRLCCKN
jgi:hypothetical protein